MVSFQYLFSSGCIVLTWIQSIHAQYQEPYKSFKPGYCNICRDVPGEADPRNPITFRYLINKDKEFQMKDATWTCRFLQDQVQDIDPYETGYGGEARFCSLAQMFAEQSCDCAGPSIPSINSKVKDINPSCDLCKGMEFDYVPTVNAGLTANTGVAGNMNCLGLYKAMSKGVLSSNLCPQVVANAGPVCCNLESINIGGSPSPQQKPQRCAGPTQVCKTNNDCCKGLVCKMKMIGRPRSCSSSRGRPRQSIAGGSVGGAAGRRRRSGN